MIKENQKLLNRLQVVLDGLVIIASYVLAWYIRFKTGIFDQDPWALSSRSYMLLLISLICAEKGAGQKAGSLACNAG